MPPVACRICGETAAQIASAIGVCLACIRSHPRKSLRISQEGHLRSRSEFGLPGQPPRAHDGLRCGLCSRDCVIGPGERGFCGLRVVREGKLAHLAGTPSRGMLHWYRDPLPTNCVADWVCSGHNQYGQHNLAVFYASCTLNCLFCQNWHFREVDPTRDRWGTIHAMSAKELADCCNRRTFCICFFGGDPASQMPHALAVAKRMADQDVRVCWETAGTAHPRLMQRATEYALQSGGCVKFDLKAYDDTLHRVLTGASNQRTLDNFRLAADRAQERPNPSLVIASTLLVPGYVDAAEVRSIARFIASINPSIPYALLAFYPNFYLHDLPTTSIQHAEEARQAAEEAGLENVRIGNRHLLSALE